MLKALYDYAVRKQLTLPAGYGNKTVKAYILLYDDGTFQDIEMGDGTPVPAPDIGSMANGKDKSNVILEKRSVVIPAEPTLKSAFFLKTMQDAAKMEPLLEPCINALKDPDISAKIRLRLDARKIKESDRITFRVGGKSVLRSESLAAWWKAYRQQFLKQDGAILQPCLISGSLTSPLATTPAISGLHAVGGHARGDSLICFDKSAFCSYNLKQAANAPVSDESFAAVKAALDDLLKTAPIVAGMKFVHWYSQDIPTEEDPLALLDGMDLSGVVFEDEAQEDEMVQMMLEAEREAQERQAVSQADALVRSVNSGRQAFMPEETNYYILLLSGVGGRVMVRRFEQGNYQTLKARLDLWRSDLELVDRWGTGSLRSCKLTARLLRLLKYQKTDTRPFERLSKELSGAAPAIVDAILTGGQLPDLVAARALNYIRSEMLSCDEDSSDALFTRDAAVWQWLKVWLLRNKGKRGVLMSEYDRNYVSKTNAYHCGALMAVFEDIQMTAMPEVKATVVQRFYAAALQSPALVLGRLSQMSVHHLEKIQSEAVAKRKRKKLAEVASAVQGKIPTVLNLEGQSEFALGYYQMHALLQKEKQEAKLRKEQKEV